jgi:solute:Na+ symporter, SSS family
VTFMEIHPVDVTIIVSYLVLVLAAGVFLSKRVSQNMDSYFLGGCKVPWALLSVSNECPVELNLCFTVIP